MDKSTDQDGNELKGILEIAKSYIGFIDERLAHWNEARKESGLSQENRWRREGMVAGLEEGYHWASSVRKDADRLLPDVTIERSEVQNSGKSRFASELKPFLGDRIRHWENTSLEPGISERNRWQRLGMADGLAEAYEWIETQYPDADRAVSVSVGMMQCAETTEGSGPNNRDEVYIVVRRAGPTGGDVTRLPSTDDYYEFVSGRTANGGGWTNQDQRPLGAPSLWRGKLQQGQNVSLYVTINEQDNASLDDVVRVVAKIGEIAAPVIGAMVGGPAAAKLALMTLAAVGGAIEDNGDDTIGGFALLLKNEGGKLEQQWVLGSATTEVDAQSGLFRANGDRSDYMLHVVVTASHTTPRA